MSTQKELKDVRLAAMNILSRREHTYYDLFKKLESKEFAPELIEQALDQLKKEGLQSDDRYAEAFIRMRRNQGKGPSIIQQELEQRGVSDELLEAHLDFAEPAWFETALAVREKKFGLNPIEDIADKAKQIRFLQYRGFIMSHIEHALRHCEERSDAAIQCEKEMSQSETKY